jgi:ABC-2 type transport system permease protein
MPLFFFSGALFPLNDLPVVLQWVVKINPLAYGVDAMRYFLTSSAHMSISFDLLVLSGVTVGLLGLATYLFSRIKM